MQFDTILIANRGEIASRVIRTARAMGLRTVAVHSDVDAGAPFVKEADQAVCIGSGPVGDSYLRGDRILEAARQTGAGAIHPGYGFLSENADFAEACKAAGITFIGPPAQSIRDMGDKAAAKRIMIAAGVPCVPGYEGEDQSPERLRQEADRIGYPVMLKATAGGGGRGMRFVTSPDSFDIALRTAISEAENAFGRGAMIIEKAILSPRHVEFQVFADGHGATVHMGERDCSVQRRHQKVIEESPCPVMTPDLRARMGQAAVMAADAIGYRGAGTVEFLLDEGGEFYFLEMNTRLQVEHPVTEMVTGLDLVALQIRVAQGRPLGLLQEDIALNGHAIEVRLYAEDPASGFLPSTGRIIGWTPPERPGLRVDSGIEQGQDISPFYDSMVAKIIAHGNDREEARRTLVQGLQKTAFFGPESNLTFLGDLLSHEVFVNGQATTSFIGEAYDDAPARDVADRQILALAAFVLFHESHHEALELSLGVPTELRNWTSMGSWATPFTFQTEAGDETVQVRADSNSVKVTHGSWSGELVLETAEPGCLGVILNGQRHQIFFALTGDSGVQILVSGRRFDLALKRHVDAGQNRAGDGRILSPMHGIVVELCAAPGGEVKTGDRLAVIEAMKMQHEIASDVDGQVEEVLVACATQVGEGDLLISIRPDDGKGEPE